MSDVGNVKINCSSLLNAVNRLESSIDYESLKKLFSDDGKFHEIIEEVDSKNNNCISSNNFSDFTELNLKFHNVLDEIDFLKNTSKTTIEEFVKVEQLIYDNVDNIDLNNAYLATFAGNVFDFFGIDKTVGEEITLDYGTKEDYYEWLNANSQLFDMALIQDDAMEDTNADLTEGTTSPIVNEVIQYREQSFSSSNTSSSNSNVTFTPQPNVSPPDSGTLQTPTPEILPAPAPEISPSPAPEILPSPDPEVSPSPAPEILPDPAPEVDVDPEVVPQPETTPEITITPSPQPSTPSSGNNNSFSYESSNSQSDFGYEGGNSDSSVDMPTDDVVGEPSTDVGDSDMDTGNDTPVDKVVKPDLNVSSEDSVGSGVGTAVGIGVAAAALGGAAYAGTKYVKNKQKQDYYMDDSIDEESDNIIMDDTEEEDSIGSEILFNDNRIQLDDASNLEI